MQKLLIILKLYCCYLYDGSRYIRAAHIFGNIFRNQETAKAHLLRFSHSLEKGMSLPLPRKGFGSVIARDLLKNLDAYIQRYGTDNISDLVLGIVEATIHFHHVRGTEWPQEAAEAMNLRKMHDSISLVRSEPVGTVEINLQQILSAAPTDPEAFFTLRRSVRQFSSEPISREQIERAVRMASRSPSVCNRQGARVYVYLDPDDRKRVLSFQDGNVGFGECGSVVCVVTSDMSIFYKSGERNQAYVDGGLFAMSLVLALHALGLGSCMLNWSKAPRQDIPMRKALGIPDSEVVVTLLVAGSLLSNFPVAASPRRALKDIMFWATVENTSED